MIWADRIAIVWAGVIFAIIFAMWFSAGDPAGFVGAALSLGALKIIAVFVLPIWLVLRGVDWLATGNLRRG